MEPLFSLHPAEERVRHLCSADPRFTSLVETIGELTITGRREPFQSLARALIGQQLSVKAAATICQRAEEVCGGSFTPQAVMAVSEDALRAAGVSKQKISYIQALAHAMQSQELEPSKLASLSDEEAIAALTKVKGVGRWTAEMFLIFSLGREDILSLGDVGLRRGFRWLNPDEGLELEHLGESWKPYRTIASLYLWEAVNRGLTATDLN